MEKLIVGIDLSDTYTQAAVLGREEAWTLPTVIFRKKTSDEWFVGEEAYRRNLLREGSIEDKLVSLVLKDGTATIGSTQYSGAELLERFLEKVLDMVKAEYQDARVSQLLIAVQNMDMKLLDELMYCADYLKIPRENVHIVSRTECFVYYVLSQRRDVWGGQVGLFSLSEGDLRYYELKVARGPRQMTAWAEQEELEESFDLSVLDSGSGAKMADKILCACGERLLQKKLFSSIFLTGKGFSETGWAPEFMKQICRRRRVFMEPAIFAKGAALKAEDYLHEKTSYPFVCLCEGKLRATVSIKVQRREAEVQMALASAGESWYEARSTMEVILDRQNELELTISPEDSRQKRQVTIPLEGFPERPDKTTRIQITTGFLDEKTMVIKIADKGFGELFPKTDAVIRQEVMI